MPPCRPYTSVNLKGIQINGFTGLAPFVKSLGFYVDRNLSWGGGHVHHIIKKVSTGIAILKSSGNYLPQRTLNILYQSLIDTHLHYGNIVWYVKGIGVDPAQNLTSFTGVPK